MCSNKVNNTKIFKKFFIVAISMVAFVLMSSSIVHAGQCGHFAYYEFEDGELTISGHGAIDSNFFDQGWIFAKGNAKTVVVEDEITEIPAETFKGLSNLTSVNIGYSVTSIGDGAFADCPNLQSILLPDRFIGETHRIGIPDGKK